MGVFGYALAKLGCEPAPLLLGHMLGPMVEEYLRRALTLSRGDPLIFLQRPISAAMLRAAACGVVWAASAQNKELSDKSVLTLALAILVLPAVRATRSKAFTD